VESTDQREALEAELDDAAAPVTVMDAAVTNELRPYRGDVLAIATRTSA
jgi:hypothetical protein